MIVGNRGVRIFAMLKIKKNDSQPYFEQVKDLLRKKIVSGHFKAEGMIPDERTFAAELHISRMTVRRAIVELTHEGLLKRVRGKGTFVRGAFAPQRKRQNAAVALIAPFERMMPNSLWYYRMLQAVQEGAEREGMTLSYRLATPPYDGFVAGLRRDASLKGLIVVGIDDTDLVRSLAKVSVPTVLLDTVQVEPRLFDEVIQDGGDAVTTAVRSLLHLGHRDIAMITSQTPGEFTKQREAGYLNALKSYGIQPREELILRVNLCEIAAYSVMRKVLYAPSPATAVFCILDELAHAVIAAVKDHGWQAPRDISVIGYGDLGHFSMPPLSTVRIPIEQMALQATQALARRFNDPTAPLERIQIAGEFVSRGTCACPRQLNLAAATPIAVNAS
jgi:DNA-binding LacI/PurR family transcriptional regulator